MKNLLLTEITAKTKQKYVERTKNRLLYLYLQVKLIRYSQPYQKKSTNCPSDLGPILSLC